MAPLRICASIPLLLVSLAAADCADHVGSCDETSMLQVDTSVKLHEERAAESQQPFGYGFPQMPQPGMQQGGAYGMNAYAAMAGAFPPAMQGPAPGVLPNMAAAQGMMPGYAPLGFAPGMSQLYSNTAGNEEETDEYDENVQSEVDKVMDVLSTKKVTDSVVDRVVEVLGAKRSAADAQKAQMQAADSAKRATLKSLESKVESKVEQRVEQKVEQKVAMEVQAHMMREFKKKQLSEKKKALGMERTLAELAAEDEDTAEKAAAFSKVAEKRQRSIAASAADKASAQMVASDAQKIVARAASRTAAAHSAAASAEHIVAGLNRKKAYPR